MKADANELHEAYVEKVKQLTSDNDRLKETYERLVESTKTKEVPVQEYPVEPAAAKPTSKKRNKKVTIADIKSEINKNKTGK